MGTLFIVSTPIGNLEDITIRAIKTLFSVDIIACEDTRRTGLLLSELKKRYISLIEVSHTSIYDSPTGSGRMKFDDHTEHQKTPELIQMLQEGKNIALVSDAGTPLISDPGYRLVSEAMKRGIKVVSIPGPSAVLAALTSSGLPTDKFLFLGYPPEKQSHRIKLFLNLLTMKQWSNPTIVFYCAPHKLIQTLDDFKETFGDIEIVITRELTKIHEEVVKLKISEAIMKFSNPKGEFVILLNLPEKK